MVTRAATGKNIRHGFVSNELIDSKDIQYPDFDAILATYRWNPTTTKYENCIQAFVTFINSILIKEILPMTNLNHLGFQKMLKSWEIKQDEMQPLLKKIVKELNVCRIFIK